LVSYLLTLLPRSSLPKASVIKHLVASIAQVKLTSGILGLGVGLGLISIPVLAVVSHHFSRRRGLAIGMMTSGRPDPGFSTFYARILSKSQVLRLAASSFRLCSTTYYFATDLL
jgi:hypothetical protein